ncbi:MAG: hypothetical protein JAY96_18230, partial [Candidatus Thiodiazotropha endolucinida]|nr:hypothetical protein [Candidatus Thiodiazotropha taylori]MCG7891405.1 hypothetical protein [Candidatus Thiodiazotropha taylori]MCW4250134.1 hypothetical protein [Candidatus Thiodiazotropha endolucinida]MCW4272067.1 hypothetical protein [Candidatus Thiodiazotropha endolucinida]
LRTRGSEVRILPGAPFSQVTPVLQIAPKEESRVFEPPTSKSRFDQRRRRAERRTAASPQG